MTFIAGVLIFALQIFLVVILVRVVFSWISPVPTNPVSRLAWQVTEPVLGPIRRRLPLNFLADSDPGILSVGVPVSEHGAVFG